MGMYDELTCKYPLPDGYADMQDLEFQTKSFESNLDHYTISADGELWITKGEGKWVQPGSSVLSGHYELEREWDERIEDYHGDVFFYDFRVKDVPENLVTFRARFKHGKLENVIVVPQPG